MRASNTPLHATMGDAHPRVPRGAPAPTGTATDLLTIRNLEIEFSTHDGPGNLAVRGVDLGIQRGRVLGVAGESGSGKSTLALAIMGLLPRGAAVRGSIRYGDDELVGMREKKLRTLRGRQLAMVSQETGGALNPTLRIGAQMRMVVKAHRSDSNDDIEARITRALTDVQLRDVPRVLRSYPAELSGGMCQRVVIAMALACGSHVLLADEPTTALDVTVQREIIRLLRTLVDERGLAVLMISHDLAVLNEICDDLVVMYRGEVVERGTIGAVLRAPAHPYTRGLLNSVPRLSNRGADLPTLPMSANEYEFGEGCQFADRCVWRVDACAEPQHLQNLHFGASEERAVRCHRASELDVHEAS